MKLSYNSPVILTFSLICVIVYLVNTFSGGATVPFFSLKPFFNFTDVTHYTGFILYTTGHANLEHLVSNLTFVLLLGPILEEKYKASNLLLMILITTVITALLHLFFFNAILIGASGIVFMFIVLISFVNVKEGTIPLTFIIVLALFISKEVYMSFRDDNISQFAHIIGGLCGSVFGFTMKPNRAVSL